MNSILFGVIALSVSNCVLLFWNLMLRSKIADLQSEIRKRREWHYRSLDKTRRI